MFRTTGSVEDIASAIVSGIDRVLAEYGEEEYERRWVQHPFPTELLREVKGATGLTVGAERRPATARLPQIAGNRSGHDGHDLGIVAELGS